MEKLIILDFIVQDVTIHIYDIDSDVDVDEDYIKKLGFDTNYCQWFFGTKAEVIEHNEVLK